MTSKRILIVDDEPMLREVFSEMLAGPGLEIKEASGGDEAFQMLQNETFDLVISDVRMPKGDGISLLSNIKNKLPNPPAVILCSGFSDLNSQKAKEMGAVELLEKPFDHDVFNDLVNKVLSRLP